MPEYSYLTLSTGSMGGLLAADSILKVARPFRDEEVWIWPRIVACVSFDTPVSYNAFALKAGPHAISTVLGGSKDTVVQKGLSGGMACAMVSAHNVFTGSSAS
jgi:hypothetical protein